ncbi:MAG: type II toxin-antitoxin system RelE/ParE family toxin [Betaproteobacteria bacterium]
MARVVYSAEALEDLERLVNFLLEVSPATAPDALAQLRSAVEVLAAHPRIGRRTRSQMRELVVSYGASGYIALYRFDAARALVRVLRIRHQREAGFRD